MKLENKYAIGTHVMFYEIEMVSEHINSLINLIQTVENKENIYIDFAFNVSQFFEKIDTTKISKKELINKFFTEYNRIPNSVNKTYRLIDNDDEFYTQTNYRREFNTKYCYITDYLIWGETDSFIPKETFLALENLTPVVRQQGLHRFIACFADRKMWDESWNVTVHPNFVNHVYDETDVDNPNQAKSLFSIEQMNQINSKINELDIQSINYPKIDGSNLILSSDLIKCGVNIPPCFIHNDDESLSMMAQKILGDKFIQIIFKNILKVHARRHPNKRLYILNENNPRGFCGNEKGNWWNIFKQMSQHNLSTLFNNQNKFYTFEDFKKQVKM
jgi:hypothetical protein